jgi:hypothetical protein
MVPQFSHSADSPIGILTFTWEIGGAGSVPVDQGGIFSDDCVSLANLGTNDFSFPKTQSSSK